MLVTLSLKKFRILKTTFIEMIMRKMMKNSQTCCQERMILLTVKKESWKSRMIDHQQSLKSR